MNKNNVSPGPNGQNKRCFQSMKGETVRKLAFSKTTLFLSFQIAYSRSRGAANQTFFSIFFTRIAFQPMIKSLAKRGQIHTTQAREKTTHSSQIFGQWISHLGRSSSAPPRRGFANKGNTHLLSWFMIRTLSHQTSHTKKLTFKGTIVTLSLMGSSIGVRH